MDNWDNTIESIAELVNNREKYQKTLGKISLAIRKERGIEGIKALVEDLKERHGITLSWKTLHNYSWVEDRIGKYNLPKDVSYRLQQLIAGTDDPGKWIDMVLAGASTNEIFFAIKGTAPKRLVECPKCHNLFEIPTRADVVKQAEGN